MPPETKEQIISILNHSENVDKYQAFYELVISRYNYWHRELKAKNKSAHLMHKLQKGEGYLLHDRRWLHGRAKPEGVMMKSKSLVFNF